MSKMTCEFEGANRAYLGDAVYVQMLDGQIILTTEYGQGATNTVILEPQTLENFITWLSRLRIEAMKPDTRQ